jgi:hypothetical protein
MEGIPSPGIELEGLELTTHFKNGLIPGVLRGLDRLLKPWSAKLTRSADGLIRSIRFQKSVVSSSPTISYASLDAYGMASAPAPME